MHGVKLNFSEHECSSRLTDIFIHHDLKRMLEGKDYRHLDLFLQFFIECTDKWATFSEN